MLKVVNGLFFTNKQATVEDLKDNFTKIDFVGETKVNGQDAIVFCALVNDDYDHLSGSFETSKGWVHYQAQKSFNSSLYRSSKEKSKRIKKALMREGKRSILNSVLSFSGVVLTLHNA